LEKKRIRDEETWRRSEKKVAEAVAVCRKNSDFEQPMILLRRLIQVCCRIGL